MSLKLTALGQAGCRLEADRTVLYIDPYLTDAVAEQYGEELRRRRPPSIQPDHVRDAAAVLITHGHLDHADPSTLLPISKASPQARFLCPAAVVATLVAAGISRDRITIVSEDNPVRIESVLIHTVPAAHTTIERDPDGNLTCVGYVVHAGGKTIYHAGDTIPDQQIADSLQRFHPVDCALLPVNERNFYRDRAGIVGNMTVREALQFAVDLGAARLIPIHWDLFTPNSVFREEIELLFRLLRPPFEMTILECGEECHLR